MTKASASEAKQPRKRYTRRTRSEREHEILAAAKDVFVENGFQNASVAHIASLAGIVEGTVYSYFDNKREILVRIIEEWYDGMLSDYHDNLKGISGARNRLYFVLWYHLKAMHDERDLCRLVHTEIRSDQYYRDSSVAEYNRRYMQVGVDVIREGMQSGEFRPDLSVRLVRDMIYGSVEYFTWGYLIGGADFDPSEIAEELTQMICRVVEHDAVGKPVGPDPSENALARIEAVAETLYQVVERLDKSTRK